MTEQEFNQLMALNHELLNVEFKRAGEATSKDFFGLILKAAIRLSNYPGGGTIVIGAEENKTNHSYDLQGLTDAQLAGWSYDNLMDQFNKYTEPVVSCTLEIFPYQGKQFVIIKVREFEEVPVICKKDYADGTGKTIVREGACYAKTSGKPESADKLNYVDFRNLLNRAVDKQLRKFVTQAYNAGLSFTGNPTNSDDTFFERQLDNHIGNTVKQAQSRGYLKTTIRPMRFSEKRLPNIRDLQPLLRRAIVNTADEIFPTGIWNNDLLKGQDWIGYDFEQDIYVESWRFFQSGLFSSLIGIREDWYERSWLPEFRTQKPGTLLLLDRLTLHIIQFFSFASRLAATDTFRNDTKFHVEIEINHLEGRLLTVSRSLLGRFPLHTYEAKNLPTYTYKEDIAVPELMANPRELAYQFLIELAYRFGFEDTQFISALMNTMITN